MAEKHTVAEMPCGHFEDVEERQVIWGGIAGIAALVEPAALRDSGTKQARYLR